MRPIHVASGPVAYLKNGVIRYKDRNIVMVVLPHKRQPFYQSTGRSSKRPKEWLPFDGVQYPGGLGEWFDKTAYVYNPDKPDDPHGFGELHRFGSQYLFEISQVLNSLAIPDGREVESGMDVNFFLGVLDNYATDNQRQTWARNKGWGVCNLPTSGQKHFRVGRG